MSSKKLSRWYLTIASTGAFVVAAVLTLIFDLNVYTTLGFLTAAIILFITDAVRVIYKKKKSTEGN
ncbi:hypothetical protein JUJ52_10870 [Virgibacillus sp. AGTR]|uniref:Uncharacterized protein n=1 Tax=Virgibacillus salarius TaxID=447199 RepID=A0A941IAL3_9BACI|nr:MULTISPECIES: hypothetical protein [Bacillaceae]MBR7795466.1 hypothetical protein [Virgibacillus salarius]MCC2250463.1 hypothetical protein [Virgibacillus sp. AGTR]NAZ08179.1 hypothetical protein [Agaribacter marinus]QRZ19838.1 hypothetical protein JUJ52_09470 [Virgibacillus sp. AGTR]